MYPKIPATPRCAEHCCRIELAPARRVAAAWLVWLVLVCAALLFAVALPLLVRIGICVTAATSIAIGIRPLILLRGPNAVRALEWSGPGELTAYVGPTRNRIPVAIAAGTFRLGVWLLVLWLKTPGGRRCVVVDGSVQDAAAFRRLCRRLECDSRHRYGVRPASTDTIRRKV